MSEDELLEGAVRELLIEKGLFTAADVTRQMEEMDSHTPADGSRFVAKVWNDPEFRKKALENGKEAAAGIGIDTAFLPNLFEAFTQESTGLTRSHAGSWSGLTEGWS
ncbi:MAG: nitrile hydratase subunit alpha [Bacteroidetes bacterium]|nr:nitrile hydratase subunit alpha [Bacteroidota bacterium]